MELAAGCLARLAPIRGRHEDRHCRHAHRDAIRARIVYSGATRWSHVWLSVQTECRRENQELEADLELAQEDKAAMGDELEALEARLRQHTRAGNS